MPTSHRQATVEAIVALEVMYDYLDGLTERASTQPLQSGERLFDAFTGPFGPSASTRTDYYAPHAHKADGGYLLLLSTTVREAFARLPASPVVAETAHAAAKRCAQGQVRVHAAPQLGAEQLKRCAKAGAIDSELQWREYLAGAVASVLAVHAQIALASSARATTEQAEALDRVYLSICAISTMLDSLIDYERDLADGDPWLVNLYGGPRALGRRLIDTANLAIAQAKAVPDAAHHVMTLAGVIAYYTSAPEARHGVASAEIRQLHRELRSLIAPTRAVMASWRLAKRAKARFSAGGEK